jgi:hypothetical protein
MSPDSARTSGPIPANVFPSVMMFALQAPESPQRASDYTAHQIFFELMTAPALLSPSPRGLRPALADRKDRPSRAISIHARGCLKSA